MLASMVSPFIAFSPLAASCLAWCSNLSLRSKCTPSHFTVLCGVTVLSTPSMSCKVMEGEQSYLGRLE